MKKAQGKIQKGLLLIVMGLMFIPLSQFTFSYFNEEPLKGSFTKKEKPQLIQADWFSNKFQIDYEAYINDNIGFKNLFVRVYNQYCFSLFKKANSVNTLVGRGGVLFQKNVIDSYFGKDFAGKENLDKKIEKYKNVQKDLHSKGIFLMTVFVPGKASFLNKSLPIGYDLADKKENNYDYVTKRLQESNLDYLDLGIILKKIDSDYPLYPKNGMHWSGYSTALLFDSISAYIEKNIKKRLRGYKLKDGEKTKTNLRYTDNDIAEAMNMIWDIENYEMYYPEIVFDEGEFYAPNTLIIGDSYAQGFYGFYPFYENIFSKKSSLWYYNRVVVWPYEKDGEKNVFNLNLKDQIFSRDVIILMVTESNADRLGFGFLEEYDYILNEKISPREVEIQKIENKIRNNKKWFESIKTKAKNKNRTIEETLRSNAIYVYNTQNKQKE